MSDVERRVVLVTGAGGMIGRAVCRELLARGHEVVGFDRRPTSQLKRHVVGELTDADALVRAAEGCDTVIHLAAWPTVGDFVTQLVPPNIIGLYHACEAARLANVRRLIITSSAQVAGALFEQVTHRPLRVADGVEPTNHYALTKVYAEEMGAMYARVHGMSVLAIRPGYVPRDEADVGRINTSRGGQRWYLSPGDAGRFYACAVESENPRPGDFLTLYAASRAENPIFEPSELGKAIGYEPRDTFPQGIDDARALIAEITREITT